MTQLESARRGVITREMSLVARHEKMDPEAVRMGVASGRVVIPRNAGRTLKRPCGIGSGLRTKVNANIGTSRDSSGVSYELKKMSAALELGADTVMDLSTGRGIAKTRKAIIARCPVPLGTVPIYEVIVSALADSRPAPSMKAAEMMDVIHAQAREGVDFFTIHAGLLLESVKELSLRPRVLDIVSRGGAFLAQWMAENGRENPLYEKFDDIIDIARSFDVTISLGDGLRPGSVADATDAAQLMELTRLGELQKRCFKAGVQSIIEGPGHVPIGQIQANVILEKSLCGQAPFYVLGPLVTDIAPGYDHITSAIGGALAASAGADFLCYVTPSEHLALPSIDDVREGVIASKIAAHAADIAKGVAGSIEMDIAMSRARARRDWKAQFRLAIDPDRPRRYRARSKPGVKDVCTMCSDYCSIKVSQGCFKRKRSAL